MSEQQELFRSETEVRKDEDLVLTPGQVITREEAERLGLVDHDKRRIRTTRGA